MDIPHRNCLVLVQHRNNSEYNDFIGKFYHFPGNKSKSYLGQFSDLPIEFVYYEPSSNGGRGEYFGYGKIETAPFEDKREAGHYFVEIVDYKPFKMPVPFQSEEGHTEKNNPHYNAQNAVRRIPAHLLDEICLDGEIQLNFNADAHLIKVLGEQLIASEKVGILELIKNAYDAHASKCTVRIEQSAALPTIADSNYIYPDLAGPVIIIEDDGTGMDRKSLEQGWLRPASTIKTNVKEKLKTERNKALQNGSLDVYEGLVNEIKKLNKNRIPLGEKGVGRFATHRLGQYLIIKTKVKELDYEYVLEVDWNKFDQLSEAGKDLSSIGVSLKRQRPSRSYGEKGSGTQIVIFGGRQGFDWDQEKIEDLNRSIIQLNSPNPNPSTKKNAFLAELIVPQIPDVSSERSISFEPTFEFVGLVDEKGQLDYNLKFSPPKGIPMSSYEINDKLNLIQLNKAYWGNGDSEHTDCGPFYIHLKMWYRKKPWIDGPGAKSFMDQLDKYGGISIYRDGINIFPAEWGAKNDWLGLSNKHIKQGFRFSYYNVLGNIEIDQGLNINLTDKTNREGLIENKAYKDLVALVSTILESYLLNVWIAERDSYTDLTKDIVRDPKALKDYTKQSLEINKSIQSNYPITEDPFNILGILGPTEEDREGRLINLNRSMKDLQESLRLIEESQEMLTEQAGYGLAIASSIHEINKITSNFFYGINEVLKQDTPEKSKLEELRNSSSSLRAELKRLSPLRALRSEKRQEFAISRPVLYSLDVYRSRLEKKGIEVEFSKQGDFSIFARYGAIVQIITNLLDNAYYWLDGVEENKRRISIQLDGNFRTLVFADSGPGIHKAIIPHLFKPGYSMKIPRSGLGLYISKHYMQEMGGDMQAIFNEKYRIEGIPGAQFLLDFGRVKAIKDAD